MQNTQRFYLGIDAGGTKTHALVADADGHVCGLGRASSGNWEAVGVQGAFETYAQAVGDALGEAELEMDNLCAGGYALSGLDFPSDELRLRQVVDRLGVPGPQVLVNDTYGALRAGTRRGHGVVVIAGTGTKVAGCNSRGERFHTFGEGPDFGDFGGAGSIVWLAMRAVAQAYTGREQPTALTDRFLKLYGVPDTGALVEAFCRGHAGRPDASLAPMVFEVAEEGDSGAQELIRHAGRELGANATAVASRLGILDQPFELVLAGGVFRSRSNLFVDSVVGIVRARAPAVCPVRLGTPPVVGSVLLGMEADLGAVEPALQQRLAEEARRRVGTGG